jgi:hypothetical protein
MSLLAKSEQLLYAFSSQSKAQSTEATSASSTFSLLLDLATGNDFLGYPVGLCVGYLLLHLAACVLSDLCTAAAALDRGWDRSQGFGFGRVLIKWIKILSGAALASVFWAGLLPLLLGHAMHVLIAMPLYCSPQAIGLMRFPVPWVWGLIVLRFGVK